MGSEFCAWARTWAATSAALHSAGGVTNLDVPVVRVGLGATRVGGGCRRLWRLRNRLTRHTPLKSSGIYNDLLH